MKLKPPNPAGRIDMLVERLADRLLERFVEPHPLLQRLKMEAGLNLGDVVRAQVSQRLKREKITDMKSLQKALRR